MGEQEKALDETKKKAALAEEEYELGIQRMREDLRYQAEESEFAKQQISKQATMNYESLQQELINAQLEVYALKQKLANANRAVETEDAFAHAHHGEVLSIEQLLT